MYTNSLGDLPDELVNSAYWSGVELAWPRDQAIEAIKALARSGRKLLGVDTWLLTDDDPPKPIPLIRDWSADLQAGADEIASSATAFIADFRCRPDDCNPDNRPVYFNLVVE